MKEINKATYIKYSNNGKIIFIIYSLDDNTKFISLWNSNDLSLICFE